MAKLLKNENTYFNIRLVYIVCILIYSAARQNITAIQPFLMSGIFNAAIIFGAGVIFLWDLIFFRNVLKTKYIWALAGLFVLTGVSILLNFKYALVDNVKAAANMFIQFFVLYAVGNRMTKERIHRDVTVIGSALGALWMVAVVVSLAMYFFDITYNQVHTLWGAASAIPQGFVRFHDGAVVMRLWGVFIDPNFAAAISIMVICFCIYMLHKTEKRWVKALHITNIVLQSLYVVLSNSRMALLILLFLALVGGWYISAAGLRKSKCKVIAEKRLWRELTALALSVVMVFACYLGVAVTKKALPYVQYGISYISGGEASDGDSATEDEIASLDREDISSKDDISNGRLKMWFEGFDVLEKNPIVGVGPRSYHEIAKEIVAESGAQMTIANKSIHNSYMELIMGNGIVGFLMLLAFFVLCAKDAFVLRFKNKGSLFTVGILMLIVLSALAGGMFISSLFYYLSAISVVAFGMLGYAVSYMQCEKQENQ